MNPFENYDKENSIVLLDGDVAVHQVSRAAERKVRWPNGVWTWDASEGEGLYILDCYLTKLKKDTECSDIVITLSSETNFRNNIYEDYKLGRDDPNHYGPLLKEFLRNHFHNNFRTFEIDGLEADDVLGILMTDRNYKKGYRKVLATIDKDLDTIPGEHFNMTSKELYIVSRMHSEKFFHQQILTGDKVDHIPGCPGYGPVTANRLLESTEQDQWWNAIVKAYQSKGLTEEDALMNARLVRILTIEEWENKKVKLWEPK